MKIARGIDDYNNLTHDLTEMRHHHHLRGIILSENGSHRLLLVEPQQL